MPVVDPQYQELLRGLNSGSHSYRAQRAVRAFVAHVRASKQPLLVAMDPPYYRPPDLKAVTRLVHEHGVHIVLRRSRAGLLMCTYARLAPRPSGPERSVL